MQTEQQIIEYFRTLEQAEMQGILEYDAPGSRNLLLYTDDEALLHTHYFINNDSEGLALLNEHIEARREILVEIYQRNLH